ncbi:hypothetical protein D3C75_1287200 [compost metagenome]
MLLCLGRGTADSTIHTCHCHEYVAAFFDRLQTLQVRAVDCLQLGEALKRQVELSRALLQLAATIVQTPPLDDKAV